MDQQDPVSSEDQRYAKKQKNNFCQLRFILHTED